MSTVYLVIPCYNEVAVLDETTKRLSVKLSRMQEQGLCDENSRILYVDDGSKDGTWDKIQGYFQTNPHVCGLKLAHNKGHQFALLAGLMHAAQHADCAISLDSDLQDDIEVLSEFVQKFNGANGQPGCDIVYGIRKSRSTDSLFKRWSAQGFYKLMRLLGVDVQYNHADYRLMSKRALQALGQYQEVNLFLRGVIPLIGFQTDVVYYDRQVRFAGESKYPLRKMLSFAWDGITSFSIKPIRLVLFTGCFITLVSFFVLLYALFSKISGSAQAGWTSIMGSIWLLGGLQMAAIGICGEYLGKVYKEVKARPRYIVETLLEK